MKNIRMYEDGNRLIIVLEGYGKNMIPALMETLQSTVNPVDHLKPHTGESSFRLKGTEQEIQTPIQEPQIQKPAFMEKLNAERAKLRATSEKENISRADTSAKTENKPNPVESREGEVQTPANYIPDEFMPLPVTEDNMTQSKSDLSASGKQINKTCPGDKQPDPEYVLRHLSFMNSYELRVQLKRADKEKLETVMRRRGSYPNINYLMNADDRTIREYIKELMSA